jgi:cysteinyl-tRNA synthetase
MKKFAIVFFVFVLAVQVNAQRDITDVKSWAYWLQNIDINTIINNTSFELIVMDYSANGEESDKWTPQQIQAVKNSGKIAIAYISIGEAENYRYYWKSEWETNPPAWLGKENPEWEGNYKVRFWDKDWQAIIFNYIDKILAQGFDGIYMDIIDGYYYWSVTNPEQPFADSLMCSFVIDIRKHCDSVRNDNDFIILPQNGCDVWDQENVSADLKNKYFDAINGIGVEDVFFPGDKEQDNNYEPDDYRLGILKEYTKRGKQVFAIDYLTQPQKITQFIDAAHIEGFVPYACTRYLDHLCNSTTDISHSNTSQMNKITPNPATDYIDIAITNDYILNGRAKVYDVLGNVVLTHPLPLSQDGKTIRLDVSGLATGVYFVRIGDKLYKFVKM